MRTFLQALVAATVVALGAAAAGGSATTPAVHGTATADWTGVGFQADWRLAANAVQTPSGVLAGEIKFAAVELPLADFHAFWARPVYLLTYQHSACVVANVERFRGDWNVTPVQVVLGILDVEGGPDLIGVTVFESRLDPPFTGSRCADAWAGIEVTEGNFAVDF